MAAPYGGFWPAVGSSVIAFGAVVEQAAAHGILADHVGVARGSLGEPGDDQPPALPVVGGLVDVGIAVIRLMSVHGEVRGARVVARRFDVRHRAPRGYPREV